MHRGILIGKLTRAVQHRFEHTVFSGIVLIHLTHKGHKRIATIKLIITQRIIAVAFTETLIIVAMAFVLRKVLHLSRKGAGRNAPDRADGTGKGLLRVFALIDIRCS